MSSIAKPTIAGILSGLAHQFIKPKTKKEGKGGNRIKRSVAFGLNTGIAAWIGEKYIWANCAPIQSFFNMIGYQGVNVFLSLLAAATEMLAHTYISPVIPKGTYLTNFLYNLGSLVIADQVVMRGYYPSALAQ